MRRILSVFVLCLSFCAAIYPSPPANAATSSVESVEKANNRVILKLQTGALRIEACSDTIVHVVYSLGDEAPKPLVPAVLDACHGSRISVKEHKDLIEVSTESLNVTVQRENGRIRFLDASGKLILEEPATGGRSLTPTVVADEDTFKPEQTFLATPGEAFYGLGQRQEGFMNWRGIPVRLQQVDAQIALPVVLSTSGYGILWNNPALTDFNPADQEVKIDPKTKKGTFSSGLAGTYGFMALGASGKERIALKVDGQQVIDVQGYLVPYAASGKMTLPANTIHTLSLEGTDQPGNVFLRTPAQANLTGFRAETGDAIDYYFMYGPNLNKVVAGYRELTGTAPLFPKWTYGFLQCREHYSSQQQLLQAAAGFRERKIPIDAIIQDWQYWGKYGWNAMKFDEQNYPDPGAMIRQLHAENIHFMISVWSKFEPKTDVYKEMKARSLLIPGTEWFDAFNPEARNLYWANMDKGLFKYGVDGWWLDATEPEYDALKGAQTKLGPGEFVRNAYPLYVTEAVYKGQREAAPGQRVFILTRSAYAGQQRNAAASWSGDIGSSWSDFRKQIPGGLNFTMSGIPYWTTDVGGFDRPHDQHESPEYHEILTRWIEYGSFCPLFRIHGNQSETEIWKYGPEVEAVFRKYDGLRYRLFPYIYSTAWMVTHDNYNLMRALPLDYRTDPAVRDIADEFMLGPSLLVNPVTKPHVNSRKVYLPPEPGWVDFWTGESRSGRETITAAAPLDQIPLYVKSGSIIPMGPEKQYEMETQGPIELRVYAGRDADFALYDDEGTNYNYEKGAYSIIPIHWSEASRTLTIGPRRGQFPGMPKSQTFRIVWVRPGHGNGAGDEEHPDANIHFGGKAMQVVEPLQSRNLATEAGLPVK